MTNPNPQPSPQRFQQVRALFERANSLPTAQREAFVRAQAAGDDALASEVLALLSRADADTTGLAGNARRDFEAAVKDGPSPPPHNAADHVQSTATGELMEKLAKAPKLDEERYAIETEVGKGGMGAVLRIHDRHLNRRLAMKVLLERAAPRDEEEKKLVHQLLGRFLEEAQVTSQLDHPGVVPVHELGLDQRGKVYFTMRLVKGRTASEVFADAKKEQNDWTTTRALEVVLKVCDTMAYAHDKGVLHRDLKPQNVMVGRFGEVYVMDWGLAKVLGQADRHDLRIAKDASTGVSKIDSARKRDAEGETGSSVVSMDGQQLGTPSYMAPEQARSEQLDRRADVYAIGAMMYELLTGRAPYVTPGVRQPAYRILNDVAEGPPKRIEVIQKGVPAELVAIVERAMQRERDGRYGSVLELAADVRAFLAQRVVKAYRTGALVEMKLWMRRNRALAGSLAAGALILVAGIAITTTFWSSEARAKEQFAAKVRQFDQLALVVHYDRLMAAESTLVPGWPDQQPAIDAWVHDAERLKHGTWIASTHAYFTTISPAESDSRAANSFLYKTLAELESKMPKVDEALASMLTRQKWARLVGPLTLSHPNAKHTWAEARAAIAKADGVVASSLYAGQNIELRDQDIWGLVPIGMNTESKLWEFYDLRSAWDGVQDPATLPIPAYGPDGRLIVDETTGIVLVMLPGGSLPRRGARFEDATPDPEAPGRLKRHQLMLSPFFLGKYEVTRSQWQRLNDAASTHSEAGEAGTLPVELISWFAADSCLSRSGMSLPSELQWEYGCCAGTTTLHWPGDTSESVKQREHLLPSEREMSFGPPKTRLLPVGSCSPNPFGLFDTCGNVWEWCWDPEGLYGTEGQGDGRRPQVPDKPRTMCGLEVSEMVSTTRHGSPALFLDEVGLRAARPLRR